MRVSSILSEAWRNITSGTTRAPLFAAVMAITIGTLTTAEVAIVHGIHNQARDYIHGGGATRYIRAKDSIDKAACDSLTSYESTEAAAALRETDVVRIDTLPGASFQAYEVGPGFGTILDTAAGSKGVWVSMAFSRILGVDVGSEVPSNGQMMRIAGIFDYPDDGRDARLQNAIVIPVPDTQQAFDECWMRSWPESEEPDALLRSTLTRASSNATEVTISQLNKSLGSSFDGHSLFAERLTRWVGPLAVGAAFFIGLTWTRRRKLEYAASLHAGQSRTAMSITVILETLAWAVLGTSMAAVVIFGGAIAFIPEDMNWVTTLVPPPLISASVGALLGALVGALVVREADLFKYFKER